MKRELIFGVFAICVASISLSGTLLFQTNSREKLGPETTGENTVSVTENGIKFAISLEKTEFSSGENIDVTVVVQNLREENVTLIFGSSLWVDLEVYNENLQLLGTVFGGLGFAIVTDFSLEPGESLTNVLNWNQRIYHVSENTYYLSDNFSHEFAGYYQIVPGTYYIRGALIGYMETPTLRITIASP